MGGCAIQINPAHAAATSQNQKDDTGEMGCTADCTPSQTSQTTPASSFQSLRWLDRLLAVWILLAMLVGVLLGNFVSGVGEALQKGHFVGVSIPIGKSDISAIYPCCIY